MQKYLVHSIAVVSAFAVAVGVANAATINYSDGFENVSFDPFWTVSQQNGTVSTSTDLSHTGTRSAKFASTDGVRFIMLTHTFPTFMTGTASVYYYDVAPGQQTLYQLLRLYDSAKYPNGAGQVGTQDFDAFCYTAFVGAMGPNANCGVFPQQTTTNVARSVGWHLLSITMGTSATSISIDGNVVYTVAGAFTFDTVQIDMQGPAFRPNTVSYFDDFNLTATTATATPEPATLSLVALALLCAGFLRFRSDSKRGSHGSES